MSTSLLVYPTSPQNIDEKILIPSEKFKSRVIKVMGSIAWFMVVYLLLLLGGIGLAVLCAYGGIKVITLFPGLLTLILGLGIVVLGGAVLFFLVKFIFSTNEKDLSHLTRITKKDHPQLFAFIKRLTKEIGAPFPKKIFISNEVNAYVFYNSNFWSMFFPVRKNLVIGLGLVNGVNVSEFKAILAHEFGHFSQRSMRLGSYVYNVNRIIHNLLYDNKELNESLEAWGNIHAYFSFFSILTEGIISGIQSILKDVYGLMNKNYLGLSRQMEFHADSVAASVSGSEALITALRRLEVAELCYQQLMQRYNGMIARNIKAENLFPHHQELLRVFAEKNNLTLTNGLPNVSAQFFQHMNTSRLVIKNQWASHPSTEDREAHLKGLNIQAEILDQSAWIFFSEPEKIQREMTEFIYEEVKFTSEPSLMNLEAFAKEYHEELEHFSFDTTYRGFYDDRLFPKGEELSKAEDSTLDSILTEEVLGLSRKLNGVVADISVLEQIQQAPKDLKTFEFAGVKCFREEAASIITQLKGEKQTLTEKLKNADDKVYSYFLLRARILNCEADYRARHERILTLQKETENDVELYSNMMRIVTPLFQERVTFEKAYAINNQIKMNEEKLKERIKLFLSIPELETIIKKEKIKTLEDFVSEKKIYFDNSRLNDAALTLLMESLSIFYMIVIDNNHIEKKKLLAWQLTLK